MDRITVKGSRFQDQYGRQRIFHGVNLVFKGTRQPDGAMCYDSPYTEKDIDFLAGQGFNVVRYGLIWDGVEPQPGEYDDAYLDRAERLMDACARRGIHLFLDMHQDLYSALYADGAPGWATLTRQPYEKTDLWSDAYLTSPAVKESYDAFWQNLPAGDGMGLLDHYAAMWGHVIHRLGNHPALIGFDFLNEPNPGSGSADTFQALMHAAAHLLTQREGKGYTSGEMAAMFADPEKKLALLSLLSDKGFYRGVANLARGPVTDFEQGVLGPFYNRMTRALRALTPSGIVFRENSYFSNMGIPCDVPPLSGPRGREPFWAYSPHGYDLVVDTQALALADNARIEVIFEAHRQTQLSLGVPVLVGEWGAFGHSPDILPHARHILKLFDRWQWSHTYWCYHGGFEAAPVLSVLRRTYPRAVSGEIDSVSTQTDASFSLAWQGDGKIGAPTQVFVHKAPSRIDCSLPCTLQENILSIPSAGGGQHLKIWF